MEWGWYLVKMDEIDKYRFLQSFASSDATADRDAWDMAIEYMKQPDNGWDIADERMFVRE